MVKGGFAYKHIHAAQNSNVEKVFTELFIEYQPKRVLEIGTFHGGLSWMIRDILDKNNMEGIPFKTYDTEYQKYLIPLVEKEGLNIEVLTKNLFSYSYLEWKDEESAAEIRDYIQQPGKTLVLCDGGCKRCEFRLISPFLKENDLIMAHDYAPNLEVFERDIKGKIWDWMEIQDSDIDPSCVENNLVPYKQELCQTVAWASRIKSL